MPITISRFSAVFLCQSSLPKRRSLVFLGTPTVAANVLDALLKESKKEESLFQVDAVVSQPSKPTGRRNRTTPIPTPVTMKALEYSFLQDQTLLCPASAKDEDFLNQMERLRPDLCITAAYGNLLPDRFLQIPKFGTLNIHPSLLPKYRGAAPVNRALEDGADKTGVSVAYTVAEMDAGPVLVTETVSIDPDIQAPELLKDLFSRGTRLLLDSLPSVFDETAKYIPQDPAEVTFARKLRSSDAVLHFQLTALELHNKVRAFNPWPGTRATFKLFSTLNSQFKDLQMKILETKVSDKSDISFQQGVCLKESRLFVQCGENSILEILKVQRLGGRKMSIRDFRNGLGKREILTI